MGWFASLCTGPGKRAIRHPSQRPAVGGRAVIAAPLGGSGRCRHPSQMPHSRLWRYLGRSQNARSLGRSASDLDRSITWLGAAGPSANSSPCPDHAGPTPGVEPDRKSLQDRRSGGVVLPLCDGPTGTDRDRRQGVKGVAPGAGLFDSNTSDSYIVIDCLSYRTESYFQ